MSLASPTRARDLAVRPATFDDAAFVADLFTALNPDEPSDPVVQRYQWENAPPEQVFERFIAERDGAPVGFAAHAHTKRFGFVGGDVLPALRTAERVRALYDFVERLSRADGTEIFSTWSAEKDGWRVDLLTQRGYRRT